MKHNLLYPFLVLLSCANAQDETALFQDAIGAAFDYLSTETGFLSFQLGVEDPMVFPTFALEPDDDVIRQDANDQERLRYLDDFGVDIEEAINTWKKYKGKDLSVYVAENHLNLLIPEDSQRDQGTNVSFSAPIFRNDTLFFCYMVFEINDDHKESKVRQYMLFGKTNDSWKFMVESRFN